MIPLRDVIPSRTTPVLTVAIITLNALVFLYEQSLPESALLEFVYAFGVVPASLNPASLITSIFLHGGWLHFLSNNLYLWIFGDNVEDRLGHGRFVLFYLLCGITAAMAQAALTPYSRIPMIGASGAIAGVMGAYLVLFPHSRVLTLLPLVFIWQIVEVPAIVFLGIWFVMQLVSGVGSLGIPTTGDVGGVAFWAHVAGFATGVVGAYVLRKPARERWEN